jgi:ABC-2 type transport system ATP-binding protein
MQGLGASFSSPALDNDLTMLGRPGLTLPVDVADDQATLFIKLYDVSPGGRATLLQSAVNATRPPAGASELTLVLEPLAYRIVAGNRLRVTLDTTDQAYALGRNPSLVKVHVGSQAQLILPTVPTITGSPVPAAARVGLPVLGIVVLALLALLFIRRHEAGMTAEAPTHPARTDQVTTTDPIVVRGLVKRYDDGKVAVDGLDLTVGQGQVFGLLGPNGAGKTTTMRMLLGLILPTEGEIRLLGQEMRPGHPVLQRVGVLVEGPGFAPYLTGRQNLLNYWRSGTQTLDQADLERSLSIADLGTAIDNPTRTYSHGMRQRLAIAQALLGRPDLLILDEPTDGLDPEQIRAMRGLLGDLGKQGQTVLVSSHLLSEVEQMCTHAAVLNAGKVVAAGPVAELVGGSHTLVVQTDDVRRARDVATAIVGRTAVRPQGDGLIIQLDGVDPADVVTALVNAGVGVSSAAPRGRLEDVFLELTGTPD